MPSRRARLLCVGDDLGLVKTRCAVLSQAGYDAQAATVLEAEILLHIEEFDLIIVAAFMREQARGRILSAAGNTPTLVLQGFTFVSELIAEVQRLLPAALSER